MKEGNTIQVTSLIKILKTNIILYKSYSSYKSYNYITRTLENLKQRKEVFYNERDDAL